MKQIQIKYGNLPALEVNLTNISGMLERSGEVVSVNVSTYAALEVDLSRAFMEAKSLLAKIGHAKATYSRELDKVKLKVLFEDYANFISTKDKKQDTVMAKELYLNTHTDVIAIQEQLDKISFLEGYLEAAVKSLDNLSRVAKKQIDIVLHSATPTISYTNN